MAIWLEQSTKRQRPTSETPQITYGSLKMLPSKPATSVCNHCRLRRRRCDRARPKCSFCVAQDVQCVYEHPADSQPSQLVQDLMRIRERLELIAPLVEPPSHGIIPSANIAHIMLPPGCPPLVIKSSHLMQVFALPLDLAGVLYRLESTALRIPESVAKSNIAGCADLVLGRFFTSIHQWYPVLDPDFTPQFCESSAAGFPPSTMSCLSLLVVSLAHVTHDQTPSSPFEVAFSMIPMVIQECSVTSIQCLVLFSLYSACLIRPREALDFIQTALLKIQPFLKSAFCGQGSTELQLVQRLYWTIYMIESELCMHLNILSTSGTMHGHFSKIPLPTNAHLWDWSDDVHSPSKPLSANTLHQRDACSLWESSPFQFPTEIQLQNMLNYYTTPAMDVWSPGEGMPDSLHPPGLSLTRFHPGPAPDVLSQPASQHMDDPVCRAKYHLYEVSIYWPVIYSIIIHGSADPEMLPYAPLFFQSVTSFLGSARLALRVCLPKAWWLCASIYVVCNSAMRALEVQGLRFLCQPQFWEEIDASFDALHRPSMNSPSVQYMWESLKVRLEGTKVDQKA